MNKPTAPITWATDANYPAGGNPWNSQPTKVVPLAGAQASGLAPKDKPPAQTLNYHFWLLWQWIAYLASLVQPYVKHAMDFRDPALGTGNGSTTAIAEWAGYNTQPSSPYWASLADAGFALQCTLPEAKLGLRIASVEFRVRSGTVGKHATVGLYKFLADGSAGPVAVSTVVHACLGGHAYGTAMGGWEVVALPGAVNYDVEAGYLYFLEVQIENTVQFFSATITPA